MTMLTIVISDNKLVMCAKTHRISPEIARNVSKIVVSCSTRVVSGIKNKSYYVENNEMDYIDFIVDDKRIKYLKEG